MLKNDINIVSLLEFYIERLNNQSKEADIKKVYSYTIKKGTRPLDNSRGQLKKGGKTTFTHYKVFKFYVADLDTGKRTILYEDNYIASNPADYLKVNYKRVLIRQFLYQVFGMFSINMETQIITSEAEKAINKADTSNFSFNEYEAR